MSWPPLGQHRPRTDVPRSSGLHHLELWTPDLGVAEPAWDWLLTTLGWRRERIEGWDLGRIWRHLDESYLVLEQSEDVLGARAERRSPGMNHLALRVADRTVLEEIRAEAPGRGWRELFADRYPHAGGEDHVAWYAEDPHGIEVELVASD